MLSVKLQVSAGGHRLRDILQHDVSSLNCDGYRVGDRSLAGQECAALNTRDRWETPQIQSTGETPAPVETALNGKSCKLCRV